MTPLPDAGEQAQRNGGLGHLEGGIAAAADDHWPILISFSFRLVSDDSLIGSGVASVQTSEQNGFRTLRNGSHPRPRDVRANTRRKPRATVQACRDHQSGAT
jgi:hypothetical protein